MIECLEQVFKNLFILKNMEENKKWDRLKLIKMSRGLTACV